MVVGDNGVKGVGQCWVGQYYRMVAGWPSGFTAAWCFVSINLETFIRVLSAYVLTSFRLVITC